MRRELAIILLSSALWVTGVTEAAKPPVTWDGLVQVPSKKLDLVYLQAGADFRAYTKVMIDPTEVAFEKNWARNYNRSTSSPSSRVSDSEVQKIVAEAVGAASDIFAEAWTKGGYAVVNAPGPDVLQVKTGVLNIAVNAPDRMTAGRTRTYAPEGGRATFFVEVRDSTSGALLGRAVDQRIVGDDFYGWRTSGSNRADFRRQVQRWAELSVRGMNELKALSPIRQ
jgi:hypothetical protein